MNKVIFLKGLQASGKSTWAKALVDNNPGQYKRINKDEIRAMFDNGKWSKGNERFVVKMRNLLILEALKDGKSVIVDDTNLNPVHEAQIRELVKGIASFEIKDFCDVDLETCIERDAKRPNSVGAKVIRQTFNQWLKPAPVVIQVDPNLPWAVISDIDGTLALFGDDKNPYQRDFENDQVNNVVADILYSQHYNGNVIIIVSGRQEKDRQVTEEWLIKHNIPFSSLFMRQTGDQRKDVFVKNEIYEREIKNRYNVRLVIDDRLQVCRMWYLLGLKLLRFGNPDSDF